MTTTFYEIPLTPDPQAFSITLSGVAYQLTVQYRAAGGTGWILDIADASGSALVSGIPLITGADLLEQYGYLEFGGRLWVQGDADPDNVPTFGDLGIGSHLIWATDS